MSIVKKCNCESEYQDTVYGKGMRLFNPLVASGKSERRIRCTVCGALASANFVPDITKADKK